MLIFLVLSHFSMSFSAIASESAFLLFLFFTFSFYQNTKLAYCQFFFCLLFLYLNVFTPILTNLKNSYFWRFSLFPMLLRPLFLLSLFVALMLLQYFTLLPCYFLDFGFCFFDTLFTVHFLSWFLFSWIVFFLIFNSFYKISLAVFRQCLIFYFSFILTYWSFVIL